MADWPHRCDERCACPLDGKPLFYSRVTGQHACMDPDCVNAHGLPEPSLPSARIDLAWEVDEMDRKIAEMLRPSIQEIELQTPVVTYEGLLEAISSFEMLTEEIKRRQREDLRRVEEAYVRALELDQGVFIATRESRVVYAEPSPYVSARMAYWVNTDAWEEVDINTLFMGGFGSDIDN